MHSRKLTEFRDEIIYKNRNPRNSRVLDMLSDETTNPTRIIPEGTIFYRGRAVDTDRTSIGIEEGFAGFSKSGSFVPPIDKTKDLRASYRFIPYLYAASSEEVAIREVCNSEGVGISLAKVVVRESLTLFDLINIKQEKDNDRNTKDNLLLDLAELYSKPVCEKDNGFDYIPTQYIAEYIKNLDYDGIVYPSSKVRDMGKGFNLVIFNYDKCEAIESRLL